MNVEIKQKTRAQLQEELDVANAALEETRFSLAQTGQALADAQTRIMSLEKLRTGSAIGDILRMCSDCQERLEKFCTLHHRDPVSVIREALGQWLSPWPHWRGCPTSHSGGPQ